MARPLKTTEKRKKPTGRKAAKTKSDPPHAIPVPSGSYVSHMFPTEIIIVALRNAHGLVATAAKALGCTPQTIYNRMEQEPCIRECVDAEREIFVGGIAQNTLYDAVRDGNLKATMYLLDRLGSKYGYTPKSISHIGGDKDAPPIKTETTNAITLDELSLEARKMILAELRQKKAAAEQQPSDNQSGKQ